MRHLLIVAALTAVATAAGAAPARAGAVTTVRASVSSTGGQANGSSWGAMISADDRFVAFDSNATNLRPAPGGRRDHRRLSA